MKPSGVNTLQSESVDPGGSDLNETVFLGPLTVEHCSGANDCTDRTKALNEMHLTGEPTHRHTTPIVCKLHTGAEMNAISKQDYEKVVTGLRLTQVGPPQCEITAYGGHNVRNLCSCQLYVRHGGDMRAINFEVTEVPSPAMLGCKTRSDLERIKFNCNLTQKPECKEATKFSPGNQPSDKPHTPLAKEKLLSDYQDRFEGLG